MTIPPSDKPKRCSSTKHERPAATFQFDIWTLIVIVTVISLACALVPEFGLFVASFSIAACGFVMFLVGQRLGKDGVGIAGLLVFGVGLLIAALIINATAGRVG